MFSYTSILMSWVRFGMWGMTRKNVKPHIPFGYTTTTFLVSYTGHFTNMARKGYQEFLFYFFTSLATTEQSGKGTISRKNATSGIPQKDTHHLMNIRGPLAMNSFPPPNLTLAYWSMLLDIFCPIYELSWVQNRMSAIIHHGKDNLGWCPSQVVSVILKSDSFITL